MSAYPELQQRLDAVLKDFKVRTSERNFAQTAVNVLNALDLRLDALETGGVPAPAPGEPISPAAVPDYDLPPFTPDPSALTLNRLGNQVKAITDALNAGGS